MPRVLCVLLMIALATTIRAEPQGQRFVAVAFHDVVDSPADLSHDAVTTRTFVQFLDWLKGMGWHAVSLDDLSAAARGERRLPDKAILLTFDDGYRSLYTRVFPLLEAYRYPAVASLVGAWMEDTADGTVLYGDERVPRTTFISWDEARDMERSGLVEFASHSYDLHGGVQANPQGSRVMAAVTWRYDQRTNAYEDDVQYAARIRADLTKSRAIMQAKLGRPPRAMTWPFGRYSRPALDIARDLKFSFALTLEPEPAYTADLYAIHRYYPSANAGLGDIVRNLRFEPGPPDTRRVACVKLDAIAAAGRGPQQDEALGRLIEGLRALGANTVVIEAGASLPSPGAPLGDVYFPTRLGHMRADLLGRATWQIRTRGDSDVFLHLPLAAAAAAVGDADTVRLFGEMLRYARADGVVIDAPLATVPGAKADPPRPENFRARRAALDIDRLDGSARLGLLAYRAAAAIDPRLRLMLAMGEPAGPPDWADIALLPPSANAREMGALASRLRAAGWLQPDASSRVAISLPAEPKQQVAALRSAQREGAVALALCPNAPELPAPAALSTAFSEADYPYRR